MKNNFFKIAYIGIFSLLSINAYANDNNSSLSQEYDLERVFLGKNSFMGQGNMDLINPQNGKNTLVPIVIISKVKEVKETKEKGYDIETQVTLELRPRQGNPLSTITNVEAKVDKNFNIIEYKETIKDPSGEKTIICKNENPQNKFKGYKFKIGYKSEKQTLVCNDGTKRSEEWELKKSKRNNYADIILKRDLEIKGKDQKITRGTEETSMTVDKDGNIIEIKSTTNVPEMFTIKYYSQDILQKN